MQHTVIALMHDRPGVLNRTVSLFRRRNFNIDSLSVATTEQPGLSRMTLVVQRDDVMQVVRQLERLIDVVSVCDVTHHPMVAHELCLVRVQPPAGRLGELLRVARECDARVLEAADHAVVIGLMGAPQDVSAGIERLSRFGILELTRSGRIAMTVAGIPPRAASDADGIPDGAPYTWQADGAFGDEAA